LITSNEWKGGGGGGGGGEDCGGAGEGGDGVGVEGAFDAVGHQLKSSMEISQPVERGGGDGVGVGGSSVGGFAEGGGGSMEVNFVAAPKEAETTEVFHSVFGLWLRERLEKGGSLCRVRG